MKHLIFLLFPWLLFAPLLTPEHIGPQDVEKAVQMLPAVTSEGDTLYTRPDVLRRLERGDFVLTTITAGE